MTVIACRECHQPVSTEAPACPHCGCPTDPKPAKAGKTAKSTLGNDPRCHVCGQSANRACSQCGQFCCANHIDAPSYQHAALCGGCSHARWRVVMFAMTFVVLFLSAFFGWKYYMSLHPPPQPDRIEMQRMAEDVFDLDKKHPKNSPWQP